MNMQEATSKMKADSYKMAALSEDTRNNILAHVKDALIAHKDEIFAANAKDMAAAEENGIAASVKKRLKFDEHKLADVTNGINELIKLADPVGQIQLKRELDEGLVLQRVSCPIGVIGIIFEARPDALVQISSLCIKSGNCAVLKGGKETANTNKALFDVIYSTAVANGAPEGCMLQASQHNEIDELLSCNKSVDLLIPRGSNAFVQYIMNNTKIPVMGHADGICHTYIDKDADIDKAIPIIIDAKTQYIDENEDKDKKTHMGEIGSRLVNKYPDFDVRNYGYSKLSTFLSEEFDDLDIDKGRQKFVSIKNHMDPKSEVKDKIIRLLTESTDTMYNMGRLNTELKNIIPGFSIKKYGYSKFSSFLKSFGCFEIVGDRVKVTEKQI